MTRTVIVESSNINTLILNLNRLLYLFTLFRGIPFRRPLPLLRLLSVSVKLGKCSFYF
jgi:hypothetical protein